MTTQDRIEFRQYLARCTNQQVIGVLEKEEQAGRHDYAELARAEARSRGFNDY